jgi:nucleotide-binding universal stress UspA family protein
MSKFASKILLATDGSLEDSRAAEIAANLSGAFDSELHLVYVEPIPEAYAWTEAVINPEFGNELRERAEKDSRTKLDQEVEKIKDLGGEVGKVHARLGRPDSEIVQLAEEIGADLVVLGSRGIGLLRRALMGSVSSSVVRHTHCSVLVVRDDA